MTRSTSRSRAAGGDEVEDDLGVGGRLEDRAVALQAILQGEGIGEIAVMGDGEAAAGKFGEQRLDVAVDRPAWVAVARRGRCARSPDRRVDDRAVG